MPKGSNGREQTKSDPWSSRLGVGRRENKPYHIKTLIVTETRPVDNKTTPTGCVAAGAVMALRSKPAGSR